jgi:dTDP-4-amino-4,6-dideoxygalactose transaminase
MFCLTLTKITMSGGIVLNNRANTAEGLRLLHNHEQRKAYEHAVLNYSGRIAGIQAAIGWIQLRKLDAILGNSGTQPMALEDTR